MWSIWVSFKLRQCNTALADQRLPQKGYWGVFPKRGSGIKLKSQIERLDSDAITPSPLSGIPLRKVFVPQFCQMEPTEQSNSIKLIL
jgi:hypothetical protein